MTSAADAAAQSQVSSDAYSAYYTQAFMQNEVNETASQMAQDQQTQVAALQQLAQIIQGNLPNPS